MHAPGTIVRVGPHTGIVVGSRPDQPDQLLVVARVPDTSRAAGLAVSAEDATPVDAPPATPVSAAYVLPPETLPGPRILVHRRCCGWDWVDTREAFLHSRLNASCVVFHPDPIVDTSDEAIEVSRTQAFADWDAVALALATPR